jgi:dolichol-phosphate hexosyltransferase
MGAELSILMPVYNERERIEAALDTTLATYLPFETELVVVDDGSTDGTSEILDAYDWPPNARVVRHERNRGKGAALRTALQHARGTFSAVLDADLEYDAADIGRLLEPLQSGDAEVVYGVRGFDSRSAFSFWYVAGNKAVTMVANVIFNSWLADIMTCHKAMSTEVWRSLDLRARGFELEGEITARVLASGRRIYEVPITYRARGREEGKKLTAVDALRVTAMLVKLRLRGSR